MKHIKICSLFLIISFWCCVAHAVCPLCTIAVCSGVGFAEWLGIDDTISGIWIGGFIVSLIFWTSNWLTKKRIFFHGREVVLTLIYYAVVIVPLFITGLISWCSDKLFGLNKLLLGIIVGSLCFVVGTATNLYCKKINHGHVYFPFQKLVFPVISLLLLSFIFYFLTR